MPSQVSYSCSRVSNEVEDAICKIVMHGQGIARLQFAAAQTVPRCQAGVRFVLGTQVLTQEAEVHRTHSASLCTRVIAERFVKLDRLCGRMGTTGYERPGDAPGACNCH